MRWANVFGLDLLVTFPSMGKVTRKLKNIEHLLLDLLQLVLHLHDDLLDVDLVGLGAEGVDLAAHLLTDET